MSALALRQQVELRERNTFRLPARAEHYIELDDPEALSAVRLRFPNGPTLVLGEGSNLVLTGDLPGLTLRPSFRGRWLRRERGLIHLRLMAGERWHDAVQWTVDQGVGGLENLALIWGDCGAAPIQNIGAYGLELADVIRTVEVYDWTSDRVRRLDRRECGFGYRDSVFKHWDGALVVQAIELQLPEAWVPRLGYAGVAAMLESRHPGVPPTPQRVADAIMALRLQKLPDPARWPNAGSFFHNPIVPAALAQRLRTQHPRLPAWPQADGTAKLSAGWLIEQAGCKGLRVGDAGVSEQHALVLINHGRASGADVLRLMQQVQDQVATHFGVALVPEPRVLPAAV